MPNKSHTITGHLFTSLWGWLFWSMSHFSIILFLLSSGLSCTFLLHYEYMEKFLLDKWKKLNAFKFKVCDSNLHIRLCQIRLDNNITLLLTTLPIQICSSVNCLVYRLPHLLTWFSLICSTCIERIMRDFWRKYENNRSEFSFKMTADLGWSVWGEGSGGMDEGGLYLSLKKLF